MSHLAGLVLTLDVGTHQLDDTLKSRLLQLLDENRETTCIPCYGNGLTYRLEHEWHHDTAPRADFPWIGRSRFCRRRVTAQTCDTPIRDPATPSPWKMRREELVEALEHLDIPDRHAWTMPELRLEAREARGGMSHKPVGLTHMCLDNLKVKCAEEGY